MLVLVITGVYGYVIEMTSSAMMYISSLMTIGSCIKIILIVIFKLFVKLQYLYYEVGLMMG
jgi:hypothetical protein